MTRFIKQPDVSKEYPFSLTTINRWRRDGTLTTYRQGKRRVLLLRSELDALMSTKEKVSAGNTDEEIIRNGGVNPNSEDKGMHFSRNKKNILFNNTKMEKNEDTRPEE